jgi:hypothetical protein
MVHTRSYICYSIPSPPWSHLITRRIDEFDTFSCLSSIIQRDILLATKYELRSYLRLPCVVVTCVPVEISIYSWKITTTVDALDNNFMRHRTHKKQNEEALIHFFLRVASMHCILHACKVPKSAACGPFLSMRLKSTTRTSGQHQQIEFKSSTSSLSLLQPDPGQK